MIEAAGFSHGRSLLTLQIKCDHLTTRVMVLYVLKTVEKQKLYSEHIADDFLLSKKNLMINGKFF